MTTSRIAAALGAAALTLCLAGCGDDSDPTSEPAAGDTAGVSTDDAGDQAASVSITDPWIKSADEGMTAAFGTLVNDGDADVTVVSATSDITTAMELHETVMNDDGSMAMQPKEGGFTIPAGGEHELAPGGDHLMVMDLTRPVEPGETVTLTLEMADGSTVDVDATVKRFTGAEEEYQDGETGQMDMGHGHGHGDSDEDSSGGM